jgi:predicted RNA-binding protein YlxR (DUF448 family)
MSRPIREYILRKNYLIIIKMKDFIVIDTEGKDYIREIAVINQQGELIYEAFAKEYFKNKLQKSMSIEKIKKQFQRFL